MLITVYGLISAGANLTNLLNWFISNTIGRIPFVNQLIAVTVGAGLQAISNFLGDLAGTIEGYIGKCFHLLAAQLEWVGLRNRSRSGSVPRGVGGESSEKTSTAGNPLTKLPAFRHVFVVMLSDQPYSAVFGPASQAPYLSKTLEKQGELLPHYDAVAHEELANGVALISGQGPTTENAANCPTYTEIAPTGTGELEQVLGSGCVYPQSTKTLPGQLTARNLTWRAYVQGMDETGSASAGCAHPALGQSDPTSGASPGTGTYSTFRNPFMYFHSITSSSSCASDDVGFDHLSQDLASASKTPNLSYVVPDRCHDGNPTPCAPGAPAGLAASETFLRDTVKEITSSKAYKENGLLVITVDEAPATGEFADFELLLRPAALPQPAVNDPAPEGRRRGRGSPSLAICEGRDQQRGTVQPLLAAPHHRGHLRPESPRLRRNPAGQAPGTGPLRRKGLTAPRGRRQRSARSW